MRFSTLSKNVTFLLAGLGLLSLVFGGELPTLSLAFLAAGFVGSYFVEGAPLRSTAWSRGITWSLAAFLAIQVFRGIAGEGAWLSLAMEFAGWLSISRLANRRGAQDHQQIAMLAFIQLIAATVLTTDLAYALLFLAFVIVTPWALTLSHLRAEVERNYPVENDARGGTDLKRVLASRRIVGPRFLAWTSLLSLPMLAMTLALFVAFPRVGLGFVGLSSRHGQHVAGFGNNVELGGFGLIRDDPTVVVRVSAGRALTPLEQSRVLRLRGTAFDHYDGHTWTRSEGEPVSMSPMGDYYPLRRMQQPDDLSLKIVLERLDATVLFLPTGTVGIRIPVRGIPGVAKQRVVLSRNHGLDLRYDSADELGLVYDAIVSAEPAADDVPVARDTDDGRYLQLPAGHERVVALAQQLTQGIADPLQVAIRLESHLRDNGRYLYSLDQPDTRGKLPLDVFLFEAKRGHCEYFATALAVMLRGVGIPSRNVTGFVGGEFNPFGGYYGLRQADAHSWVEALIPERGWVTLDPTPVSSERLVKSPLFASVNAMIDAARAYWMTRVVGYDLRTQIGVLRSLSAAWRRFSWPHIAWGKQGDKRVARGERPKVGTAQLALATLSALVVIASLAWIVLRFSRRRAERNMTRSAELAQRMYVELQGVLAQKGRPRPPHVTAEAHARELEHEGFAGASAVRALTTTYLEARYGRRVLTEAKLRELRKLLADVKRAA